MRKVHRKDHGLAMLESVLAFTVLLALLVAGIALGTLLQKSYSLNHLVDQQLDDQVVAPLKLGLSGELLINNSVINSYLSRLADQLESGLADSDADNYGESVPAERYLIEVAMADVALNPQHGTFESFLSVTEFPFSVVMRRGSFVPSAEHYAKVDWVKETQRVAASPLTATPSGLFQSDTGAEQNYLPRAALIAVRVFFKSTGGFTASFFESIGSSSVLTDMKVISLRGVIK